MKITKIKKKKNIYEVVLSDNNSLSFYDDTIIKYNLLKPRELPQKELEEIIKYNNEIDAYHKSLKYLTVKLRTKNEVRKKLKEFSSDIIEKTIKRLEKDGYLNDDLYVKSFITDKINLSLNGPNKIKQELKKLGFNESLVNEYLLSYNEEIWNEKIDKIINKKIKSNHNLSRYMLINKIKKDLINMGYNVVNIDYAISNTTFEENTDILEKEMQKELRKLSRKLQGEELIKKLRYNMYKKGFDRNSIERLISKEIEL